MDVVFSSPPYFVQERYSDDAAQSWKRYPDEESWLNGFMGTTLDNCAYCLKPGGVLAINIANVSSYKGSLEDVWRIARASHTSKRCSWS